jgi:non-ribosomal peptide synthetase component F
MDGGDASDRTLGLFINTLPFRFRVREESAEASVRKAQALLGELMRHEHASLGLAQRCSGVLPPTPLFSALFNYRRSTPRSASFLAQRSRLAAEERTNYPVVLSVDDWSGKFSLASQVVDAEQAEAVCRVMRDAISRLVHQLEFE